MSVYGRYTGQKKKKEKQYNSVKQRRDNRHLNLTTQHVSSQTKKESGRSKGLRGF